MEFHATDWYQFFNSLTEDELEGIALLRVVECTNGCIQHAFRGNHPKALSVEQTREAMKFSMGLMKTMDFELGGDRYSFSESTEENLRKIRELYVKGFKQNDDEALDEFLRSSVACATVLGKDRIQKAAELVIEHIPDVIPPESVRWGVDYLHSLMETEE